MRPYRPDIDGLRAVAIIPVILFHLGTSWLPGGFVGVDVFFVISGYLIGQGILNQLALGTFSLADFYERRFRRILPAFFLMLLLASIIAGYFLLPKRLMSYGTGLAATALSISNFYFLQRTNYFFGAENQVLLHTWSLAVEEQFYLLFPLFAMVLHRRSRLLLGPALLGASAAFFILSVWMLPRWPAASFFMLAPRAWELLLGALVARYEPLHNKPRIAAEAGGAIGLLLILVSMAVLTHDMPFPGVRALAPCVGAALVIAAGTGSPTRTSALLSLRPFAWVGLISYSLYLFHWPVIVFVHEVLFRKPDDIAVSAGILGVTVVLAWTSWRYVEGPMRRRPASRRTVFLAAGLAVAGMVGLAAVFRLSGGFPWRFSVQTNRIASYVDLGEKHFGSPKCGDAHPGWMGACLNIEADRPNVLVLGDSYSAHLWYGLNASFPAINFQQAAQSSCPPLISFPAYMRPECSRFMVSMFNDFVASHPHELVLLAGQWNTQDVPGIALTLAWLNSRGISAVLVGPPPQYLVSLPQLLAVAEQDGNASLVEQGRKEGIAALDATLETLARENHVPYISLYRLFCTTRCATQTAAGVPLQFDTGHLTPEGSVFASQAFRDQLGKLH